jgi:leucyl/phenylalanyl-tRNA---protein transferase
MLDPDVLLRAYGAGIFPMADDRDAESVFWVEPKKRGILPLDRLHISRSLSKTLKSGQFIVTRNEAFGEVVRHCAEAAPHRPTTWINREIEEAVVALHHRGSAHSIEVWEDQALVGGLYGIGLGKAFFGESMFSRTPNASKVALVHLVEWMKSEGQVLLDCQFITPHLASLGAIEVSRKQYLAYLGAALE